MRKIIIILTSFFTAFNCVSTFAQESRVKFGVGTDFNLPTYKIIINKSGTSREADYNWGWGITGNVDMSIYSFLALHTGLALQSLGATLTYSEFGNTNIDQKTYWAQIPFDVVLKIPILESKKFIYFSAGPYLGVGLWGSNGFSSSYKGSKDEFEFGDSQKRLDYGANFELGYNINQNWRLGVGYQYGMQDALASDRYDQFNRTWKASLKYYFNSKK